MEGQEQRLPEKEGWNYIKVKVSQSTTLLKEICVGKQEKDVSEDLEAQKVVVYSAGG